MSKMLKEDKYKRWNDEMKNFERGLFRVHDKYFRCLNVESFLKILGMGFAINRHSYLRDPWNWLDFFSMVAGWIEQLPQIPRLKYLRTLRVIRPLRSVKAIPSMRRLIKSLLKSLPMLVNVLFFLFFFFLLFGILGVSLFKGNLLYRCRFTPEPLADGSWPIDLTQRRVCSTTSNQDYQCQTGTYCRNPADANFDLSPKSYEYDDLTYYGLMNFDDIGIALLTIFQVITLEGWAKLMYMYEDTDANYMSPIYFLILVFFGGFFLLNLILAVILDSFAKIDKEQRVQELQDQLKRLDITTKKTVLTNMRTKGGNLTKKGSAVFKQNKSINDNHNEKVLEEIVEDSFGSDSNSIQTEHYFEDENDEMKSSFSSSNSYFSKDQNLNSKNLLSNLKKQTSALEKLKKVKSLDSKSDKLGIDNNGESQLQKQKSFDQGQYAPSANPSKQSFRDSSRKFKKDDESSFRTEFDKSIMNETRQNTQERQYQQAIRNRLELHKIYQKSHKLVISKWFQLLIFASITLNTLGLSLDRYPISDSESSALEIINLLCFCIFSFEMLIKLIALGPKLYFKDRFNSFDSVIILLSIIDIALKQATNYDDSVLLAFRAARLLRIFKLAKQWDSLQDLIVRIGRTLKDISNFSVILFLFIFTFALLGMELFAYRIKFDDNNQPINIDSCNDEDGCVGLGKSPRLNFDTWVNAMITIFVLLVGDDWNQLMIDYARASSFWVVIFFVTLTIFGNIILLNLFLAILLKDFEHQHEENEFQLEKLSIWVKIKHQLQYVLSKLKSKFCKKKAQIYTIQNLDKTNPQTNKNVNDNIEDLEFQNSMIFSQSSKSGSRVDESQQNSVRESQQDSGQNQKNPLQNEEQKNYLNILNYEEQGQINSNRPFIIKIQKTQNNSNFLDDSTTNINLNNESHIQESCSKPYQASLVSSFTEQNLVNSKTKKLNKSMKESSFSNNQNLFSSNKQLQLSAKKQSLKISESSLNKSGVNIQLFSNHGNEPQVALFSKTLTDRLLKTQLSLEGKSLYLLSKENRFRQILATIVRHKAFDAVFLLIIIASTIILSLDEPLSDPNSRMNKTLDQLDIAFSILFLFECILKIFVFGLAMNGKQSYLQNGWNILDFIIVCLSLFSLLSAGSLKVMKSIRLFRILRPLRVISKNEELKIAIRCLLNSVKDIMNVFIIAIFSFSVYAIFGVNFFKGEFYQCQTDHLPQALQDLLSIDNSYSKWQCLSMGGEWVVNKSNFDNVFYGLLTLFQMSTTENWVQVMWNGVDSTQIDYTYQKDLSMQSSLFFIFFILLGSLFMMNLFVGIVINTFKFEKEKIAMNYLISDTQKEWILVQINCLKSQPKVKPKKLQNKFRRAVAQIARSQYFEGFIILCIIANIIVFGCNWYRQPDSISSIFEIINHVFTAIFTLEVIFKLITMDKDYFKDGWNLFDFIIVLGTYIQILMNSAFNQNIGAHATFLRVFRLGRILRLIKRAKSLNSIFMTLISSIPSLANIGFILFLFIYLYALLGVSLFGKIKIHGELDDYTNFQNFINAFLTLVRCATGESWNDIMKALMDQRSITYNCVYDPSYEDILSNNGQACGCGNYWIAMIYFTSYQLLVTFISLNLFIAIILEGFNDTNEKQNLRVDDLMINKFIKVWRRFDPEGTGFIDVKSFKDFLQKLLTSEKTFIRGGDYLMKHETEINKFIAELELPLYHGFKSYSFYDVLNHLCRSIFKVDFDKASMVRRETTLKKQHSMHSARNSTAYHHLILNSDQLEYNSFEELMTKFYEVIQQNKVQLYEEYKKHKQIIERRKMRHRDKYEGHFYDSRVIIYMPVLIQKLKNFTKLMKEQRLKEGNEFLQVQALQQIQMIKLSQSPQREKLQNRVKRNSVFIALAYNAKFQEQQQQPTALGKNNTNNVDTQNTLSPFRVQQNTFRNNQSITIKVQSNLKQSVSKFSNSQYLNSSENGNSHMMNSQESFVKPQTLTDRHEENKIEYQDEMKWSMTSNQDISKHLTEVKTKFSGRKYSFEEMNRGVTTISGYDKHKALNQEMIIEEEMDCESPLPKIKSKDDSDSENDSISEVDKVKELSKTYPDQQLILQLKPVQIIPDQISQNPTVQISSKNSSSSNTPKNLYSPTYNFQRESSLPPKIYGKKNTLFMILDRKLTKLQPDEVIDEEKSYEETQTMRNRSGSEIQKKSQKYDLLNVNINNYESAISQKDDYKRIQTYKLQDQTKLQLHQQSKLTGAKTFKFKKSSFANVLKSSVRNATPKSESIKELNQENKEKQEDLNIQDKFDITSQNNLGNNEFIDFEKYLRSSNSNSIQQDHHNFTMGINQTDSNQLEEYKMQNSEGLILDEFSSNLQANNTNNLVAGSYLQLGKKQKSQITFGNTSYATGQRLETHNENEGALNTQGKKLSSNTTQLFFNSYHDLNSVCKRSSRKQSSVRYQNVWDENQEKKYILDSSQNEYTMQLVINDSIEDLDKIPNIKTQKDQATKSNSIFKERGVKLRDLLNIDIESSDISSNLYLDEEEKISLSSNSVSDSDQKSIVKRKQHLKNQRKNFDSPIILFDTLNSPKRTQVEPTIKVSQTVVVNQKFEAINLFTVDLPSETIVKQDSILGTQREKQMFETSLESVQSPIQTEQDDDFSELGKSKKLVDKRFEHMKNDSQRFLAAFDSPQRDDGVNKVERFWMKVNQGGHDDVNQSEKFLTLSDVEPNEQTLEN
eukprot:403340124